MVYKFCPACGGKLPQDGICKFCPHCGQSLPVQDEYGTLTQQPEPSPPLCSIPTSVSEGKPAFVNNREQFSVVLKSIRNKDRLAGRLSQVLKRTAIATRMAVDLAPCLILYKSKAEDVKSAVAIFEEEGSAYTVINGDFETTTPVKQLIAGYHQLDRESQLLLEATPAALWLGEEFRLIIPDVGLENERGLLVITGRNLCFIASQAGKSRWNITPYSQIAEIIEKQDGSGGFVEVIYREFGREDAFFIADELLFRQVCDELRNAIEQIASV
ncbi:zinc ribbon domain-containing protein [Anaerospora sp.]|uniref:zinc ribbon domain-containing protein n=1 Tax=Anaerospora sp. TaxID=1960278 RepID=UPI002899AB45|nr:zinc ribbon domain-containing protein [Anaerospora sp.]